MVEEKRSDMKFQSSQYVFVASMVPGRSFSPFPADTKRPAESKLTGSFAKIADSSAAEHNNDYYPSHKTDINAFNIIVIERDDEKDTCDEE
ncbi:MAG: hypothetical protein ABFC38_09150 [Methanospirillum sp.]